MFDDVRVVEEGVTHDFLHVQRSLTPPTITTARESQGQYLFFPHYTKTYCIALQYLTVDLLQRRGQAQGK